MMDGTQRSDRPQSRPLDEVRVKALFVSPGHDFFGRYGKGRLDHGIEAVEEVECVAGRGLRGDRFFDYKPDYKGQITFFDAAVVEEVRQKFSLPEIGPELFRRNVILSGLNLNTLIGQHFSLQGIEFVGSEECRPCFWLDGAIAEGVEEFLRGGRGGLRARILSNGILRRG